MPQTQTRIWEFFNLANGTTKYQAENNGSGDHDDGSEQVLWEFEQSLSSVKALLQASRRHLEQVTPVQLRG
jgi:hypothetical protein